MLVCHLNIHMFMSKGVCVSCVWTGSFSGDQVRSHLYPPIHCVRWCCASTSLGSSAKQDLPKGSWEGGRAALCVPKEGTSPSKDLAGLTKSRGEAQASAFQGLLWYL